MKTALEEIYKISEHIRLFRASSSLSSDHSISFLVLGRVQIEALRVSFYCGFSPRKSKAPDKFEGIPVIATNNEDEISLSLLHTDKG